MHQIQSKTGLYKSIISRIKKERNQNKKNNKEGHSFKLSHWNKQTIIHQITTRRVNNAVQAIIHQYHHPQPCPFSNSQRCTQGKQFLLCYQEEMPFTQKAILNKPPQVVQYHEN